MSSPDGVILSQLQAISQLFSSYPPSEEFCQVSELTIHVENGRRSGEMYCTVFNALKKVLRLASAMEIR